MTSQRAHERQPSGQIRRRSPGLVGPADELPDRQYHQDLRPRARPAPDFSRAAFCIFGVTFDNLGREDALAAVLEAVRTRRKYLITTPNLNFVVRSVDDDEFRASIVRSDLNLVDGMPLVWAGRWFGVDVEGRVAGADLFESMRQRRDTGMPLKVYLFGGPAGVARLAAERLNAEAGGARCVGYHSPGYGTVAEISTPEIIRDINASGADFLLVALGAHKGQSWIEHNMAAIEVPVISHLGAVINFLAGTVRRAPVWFQNAGLEWAWRVYREPKLWRRYLDDGWVASCLMARTSITFLVASLLARRGSRDGSCGIEVVETHGDVVIKLGETVSGVGLAPLRAALQAHAASDRRLSIDVSATSTLGSSAIALLLMLRRYRLDLGRGWHVVGASSRLIRICNAYGARDLTG